MGETCKETVYRRDTYRYTGRTKGGFEMHYTRDTCRRKAGPSGYCWQHDPDQKRKQLEAIRKAHRTRTLRCTRG